MNLNMNMKENKKGKKLLPFVSLCTPTFNRRPFIPYMIKCFEHQTYPKDRIEWIIIDDGTDPIEDLVQHIPQVKYFYYKEKMLLGKKRNVMHSKCSGDIIIYMDDDDYYPEERISHAVETLLSNPTFLIAGSSEMHVYFDTQKCMYQCGPYKPYHSTAATFAFKKELLQQTSYDENNAMAEENKFTKGYTIPLIQLNPLKSILVFSHQHNSLNKERLLENKVATKTILSNYTVDDFVKDPILKQFYMHDMNTSLENYEPGKPENKPHVLEQIQKMDEERQKKIDQNKKNLELQERFNNQIKDKNMEQMRNEYEKKISDKNCIINELLKRIKELTIELSECKKYH